MQLFETLSTQQKLFINQKVDELTSTVQSHIQFIKKQNRMNEGQKERYIPKKENIEDREQTEEKIVVIDDRDDLDKELENEYKELENDI